MPHTQSSSDSRDCGAFFLDVIGQYAPGEIVLLSSTEQRETHPRVEEIIERTWQEHVALAQQQGRRLFNGRLARLVCYEPLERRLELTMGEVSYREFLGTNLYNAALRYTFGGEILADPLGASAAIVSEDGYVLMGRRSQQVAFHAGLIHPFGGMVELGEDGRVVAPYDAVMAEVLEETGLPRERTDSALCLGIVRDKKIVQPELVFWMKARADVAEVRKLQAASQDAHEHSELIAIRSDSTSVVDFIKKHYAEMTPVATATLLLHGQYVWGSGWFTAARGYLRKVI